MRRPLPTAVLAAVGLEAHAAGVTDDTSDTDPSETADTGDSDVGPCLSIEPCLSQLPPKGPDCGCDMAEGPQAGLLLAGALAVAAVRRRVDRRSARKEVLDRGVLPEDLARAIRNESGE